MISTDKNISESVVIFCSWKWSGSWKPLFPMKGKGSWVLLEELVVRYPLSLHSWVVSMSLCPLVPLLRDSRGFSLGLLGLLGHSFVIMTFDLCRPVFWEECRRCLPWLRLMMSRCLSLSLFLLFSPSFFQHLDSSTTALQPG